MVGSGPFTDIAGRSVTAFAPSCLFLSRPRSPSEKFNMTGGQDSAKRCEKGHLA